MYAEAANAFSDPSKAFSEGGSIPELHSCQGGDVSPSLEWSGEPNDVRSFALILEDPDAPAGTFCHWVLYDIPATLHTLPQGVPAGTSTGTSGTNDFGRLGYGGPCPPAGPPHRYFFRLYALDVHTLGLAAGIRRAALLKALEGRILAQTQCMGRYQRR
jgi:Raf kinase inhibitor-like YbhB/YbcL family protein